MNNNKNVGDFEVTDSGIARIIKLEDYGGYISEIIIPKEAFVEAYNKYICEELEKTKLISQIKVNIDDMEARDRLIKEIQSVKTRTLILPNDEPQIFNLNDLKLFIENKLDMQDLYLPSTFFMLLDEYFDSYFGNEDSES